MVKTSRSEADPAQTAENSKKETRKLWQFIVIKDLTH